MSASNGAPASTAGHWRLAERVIVSRMGLGAMQLPGPGVWGPAPDRERALAVLRDAVALGITHIDTSGSYGPAVANQLIHDALHPYPQELVIATKVGAIRGPDRSFAPAARPGQLRDQVHENLRQLGLERLELVYLRIGGDGLLAPDCTPLDESLGSLIELREQGLIGHLGLSGVTAAQLEQARELTAITAVQNRYHLLDRASGEVLAACREQQIAFVPYFPLAAGLLDPALDPSPLPPGMGPTAEQAGTLDRIAARHGATRPQVALAWLLQHAPNILLIPGTSSPAHLAENAAAGRIRLTADDRSALDAMVPA